MPEASASAETALDSRLRRELAELRAQKLNRERRVIDGAHGAEITVNGRRCINFCSNDYLGLAADPRLAEAAAKVLKTSGTGSGAAALVSGYNREHCALEEELAAATGRPRALLFATGWAANIGVLRALLGKGDTLIADELNHASLIDGGRLSGANYVRVPHRDVGAFEAAVASATGERLMVTDCIFSMDGDFTPLSELNELSARSGCPLMIDDAHGFGILEAPRPADIYVATLGKAVGAAGAFVAGSEALIEFLIHRARSWVFSTAPPPAIAAAARKGLEITRSEEGQQRRNTLFLNIGRLRHGCKQLDIALGDSATPIQPLIVGDEGRALRLSQRLFERGLWVAAIRPPTVPRGTSRLRITLSAAHTEAQIDLLLSALADAVKEA